MTCPGRFCSFDNNDFQFDRPDVPFDEGCCPRNPWSDFAAHFVWGARRPVIFVAVFREPPLIGAPEPEFIDFTPLPFERSPSGFADRQPYAAKDDPGPTPPGFVAEKWENPDYHSIKYDVSRNFARVVHLLHAIPDEAGRKRFAEEFLKTQIPVIEALGGKVLAVRNEKILLDAGEGSGPIWIDTIRAIGTDAAVQWLDVGRPSPEDLSRYRPVESPAPPGNDALPPAPPGYDATKWNNPNYHSIKYDVSRNFIRVLAQLQAIPDEEGRKRFAEQFLKSQIPLIESLGGKVLQVKNEKLLLDAGDGKPHWIDTIRDIGGDAALQWIGV